jgi:hypothetical protein
VSTGGSCEEACGERSTTYYSNCTNITDDCCLYLTSSCDTCASPGFYAGGNDNGCYTLYASQSCDCALIISENCASDFNLKIDIKTLDGSLEKIMKLNPVEFDWSEDVPEYSYFFENGKIHSLGFIAQEVRSVIPEIVNIRSNGYYYIEYPKLNAYLVQSIKEHQVFIDTLETSIIELEKLVNE